MAQIKIYARRALLAERQALISQAVHTALVSALQYPQDKKFQRFFPMDEADFVYPADRSERYTIIEVSMFETPRVNWGIRGMNGEDLPLGYKVDV